MKQNIGVMNAIVRITCGFAILTWATAQLVRKPNSTSPMFIAIMGSMKIAEGITKFCPLTFLFETRSLQFGNDQESNSDSSPMNPS